MIFTACSWYGLPQCVQGQSKILAHETVLNFIIHNMTTWYTLSLLHSKISM